jgi:hypothetical protein
MITYLEFIMYLNNFRISKIGNVDKKFIQRTFAVVVVLFLKKHQKMRGTIVHLKYTIKSILLLLNHDDIFVTFYNNNNNNNKAFNPK